MKLPRAVVNRLLSTAQTAAGLPTKGVVTRDADGVWRVEAERVAEREVVANWVVRAQRDAQALHSSAPTPGIPILHMNTDTKGVLQLTATLDGADIPIDII